MAIGRISGPLLKANLIRNGVDLAFETDLLYLDVSDPNPLNHKIGIKTQTPTAELEVSGTIKASQIETPIFSVNDLSVGEVSSDLIPSQNDTYDLGETVTQWRSLTVGQISVDALFLDRNTITIIDSNADIELKPVGTGTVVVDTDTALQIPYGPESTRPSGRTAQIRFNETDGQFEGYNGTGWISLGATRDVDGNTQITAELTTGANDDTFRFYNDGTLTGTWDINRLDIHQITVDNNLLLDENVVSTVGGNTDLELQANGTGRIYVPNNNVEIDNVLTVNGVTNFDGNANVSEKLRVTYDLIVEPTAAQQATLGANIGYIRTSSEGELGGSIVTPSSLTVKAGSGTIIEPGGDILLGSGDSPNAAAGTATLKGGDGLTGGDVNIAAGLGSTPVQNGTVSINGDTKLFVVEPDARFDSDVQIVGDTTINSDLTIDGGDLVATTTTFNLINTTATTLNIGGESTAVSIGANSGVGITTIKHDLNVDGSVILGNQAEDSITFNTQTLNAPNEVILGIDDANNTFISTPLNVRHRTSGTPANGIGTGIRFITETGNGIEKYGMSLDAQAVDTTSATEDFDFVVRLMEDGNLIADKFRVTSTGTGRFVGNVEAQGGTISTIATTANVMNTAALTVNAFGAATNLTIGSTTGTTNIRNSAEIDGNVTVGGTEIATTASSLDFANENTTTVNAFGEATTINIGADTGTTTVRNNMVVDGDIEITDQHQIKFKEPSSAGSEYISVQAPDSLAESYNIKLPQNNGRLGQLLATDGNNQLKWVAADTLVGNRLYVSAAFGDDANNGFDAPVKTIKRAAELINGQIYSPKRTVSTEEYDTIGILRANKEYLTNETTGYIDNNFAFVYDDTKCSRDTTLIVQSLAFDLLFNGNTQSTFAGLQYYAQAATTVPGQVNETISAIAHAKSIAVDIVQDIAVTAQKGNTSTQVFSADDAGITGPATSTEAAAIATRFDLVIDIITNGTSGTSDTIFNNPNGNASTNTDVLNAFALLQANRQFIQDDTIAYINQNFAFSYDTVKCARDTGLVVESLAFDALYQGNSQSIFAGLQYYAQGSSAVGAQSDETIAALEHARDVAKNVVLNNTITVSPGNTATQTFDTLNPGSGAGSAIIEANFNRVLSILDASETDITGTIVDNGERTTSNSLLNTYALLEANKEFIKDEVIAYIDQNFNFTYDSAKCERDVGLILDGVSYDIALGTNFNALKSGLAYQRALATNDNLKAVQLTQTVAALTFAKGETNTSLSGNGTAQSRGDASWDETIDILQNGSTGTDQSADALVFPNPTGVAAPTAEILAVKQQLTDNRAFIQAEIVAFVDNNDPPQDIDTSVCGRDTGYIVDALIYDALYGGNSAIVQAATAYFDGVTAVISRAYDIQKTADAYDRLKVVVGQIITGVAVTKTTGNTLSQTGVGGASATSTEVTDLENAIEIVITAIENNGTVPTVTYPDLSWVDSGIISARNQLLTDKATIISDTTQFIADTYQSLAGTGYDPVKCERDTDYIIDSVAFDLLHGGNRQSTQSGVYYYNFNAADSVIEDATSTQVPQTIAAYTYLKTLVEDVISNQDPVTQYQSVVERVEGLPATATQVSSINADIDRILNILTNGPSVVSSTGPIDVSITPAAYNDGDIKAYNLLKANKDYIAAEINGYIQATFSTIAGYDETKCERDTGYIIDSISFDIKYGGLRQTVQSGVYYYNNAADLSVIDGQSIQTIAAYNYLKTVVSAVVTATGAASYTPLQSNVTITTPTTLGIAYATSAEYGDLEADIDRILDIIQNGPSVAEPKEAIALTEVNNVDVQNAHTLLRENAAFIAAEVIQFIDDTYTGLVYNKATCARDIGYMIDAVIYDMEYGGNAKSIYAGEVYYNATTSANVVLNSQKPETVQAVEHLRTIAGDILQDQNPTIRYTKESRVAVADVVRRDGASITTSTAERATETSAIQASIRIISDTIDQGIGTVRPIDYGPGYFAATGSIFVASGDYVEDNPVIIPDNTAVIGSDLRSVIIRPKNSKKDIFRLRNGSYMYGFTWRDNIDPVTKVPQFTWDFATTFDQPAQLDLPRGSYDELPLTKPVITQSPYIQNVSIISFLGGSGALIDGNLVETPNIPAVLEEVEVALNVTTPNFIPEQGKSMVANAYTMVSFGGIGWKLVNDAYAQIVSCFQIFLLEGVVCQRGGYCSITNSATNFGLYALRASGYSPNAFTFDRGFICETGVAQGKQTLTAIGMKRAPVNEFVVRIRTADGTQDITTQYFTERERFDFDPTATTIDIATNNFNVANHGLSNKSQVIYFANGGTPIGGLEEGTAYYVFNVDIDNFELYFDEALTIPIDITSVGAGGSAPAEDPADPDVTPRHTFRFQLEEFFVDDRTNTHTDFQEFQLDPANSYTFVPGTTITGTTVVEGETLPNSAFVYTYDDSTKTLVVAVNEVIVDEIEQRVKFNDTSIIDIDQGIVPISFIDVVDGSVSDVEGLWSSTFTIESTITNSLLQNVNTLPGRAIWFHRPSIVNSSSHTWEYAGSGIDYNALPQNGGQTREEFEQYNEPPGRVYTSGTNELGDFKVGDFITAENKTGNISFRNEVTVGQLNALRLSLSDIEINKISNDPGLGDNEPGGPSDSALITQLSIRTFIANRLGNVVDKQVSTNANAGALVQLNSSGQINRDLIPPLRSTNVVTTVGFNSRLEVFLDQPAINILASDTVVETYQSASFTLSGNITVTRGQVIKQQNSGATGVVVLDGSGISSIEVANVVGTFTTNVADELTDVSDVSYGVYPTAIGAFGEQQVPYVLTTDTVSQFLVLYDKTTGDDYDFTNGNLVSSTINQAVGQVTNSEYGVVVALNTIIYNKGTNYLPAAGSATYLNVELTGGSGTGAIADITVTNGIVANVDLRRGGTGYIVGESLSANNADIGGQGAGFNIPITDTQQRVFVDLTDGVKFIGTETVPDFIADNNASVKTIGSLTTAAVTKAFDAQDQSGGGAVDYSTSRIELVGHGFDDADPVIYTSGVNTPIAPLNINQTYFVKVITNDIIELFLDYSLVTKVSFTSSSTGIHTLTILPASQLADIIYIADHGFLTGVPVEIAGSDVPAGLTAQRYYVGSVTQNSFTLHNLRLDALASVNGLSVQAQELIDTGTGSMSFTEQNVQIVGNINTSARLAESFSILSTTNVDAGNIVSGIVNTSRLAVGTANSDTFLRGDSTWQTVITSITPNEESPVSIAGNFTSEVSSDGSTLINNYYGDVRIDIDRVSQILGDLNWTNPGVARFSKGQFDVTGDGQVAVKSGRIDALSLGGLQASYFLDPNNLSQPVPVNRGGTGLNAVPAGSMLYGSTSSALTALAVGTAGTVMISTGTAPVWSSSLALPGNLTVNGDTVIGDSNTDALTFNADTALVPNTLTFEKLDSSNNGIEYPVIFQHSVTGVPDIGVGTGVKFDTETAGNVFKTGSIIESVTTDVTSSGEDFDLVFKTMVNGATAAQVLRLRNNTITVGAANTNTTITTTGTADLTLNTNNGTDSGYMLIRDGVNSDIDITANGNGEVNIGSTTNIDGDLTVTGTTSIGGVFILVSEQTALSAQANVNTFNKTVYRSAKYQIQVTCTSGPDVGEYQASEMSVVHNGTTAYSTEYAVVRTGNALCTFTVDVSGDDVRLRGQATSSNVVDVRVVRIAQPL